MGSDPSQVGSHYLQPEGFRLPGDLSMLRGVSPQVLGQLIEEPARRIVSQYYNFPLDPKAPSATGPDIIVPKAHRKHVGFDIADIKPLNVNGVKKFWEQIDRWRDFGWAGHPPFQGRAALFGYDMAGTLYLYGIFDM